MRWKSVQQATILVRKGRCCKDRRLSLSFLQREDAALALRAYKGVPYSGLVSWVQLTWMAAGQLLTPCAVPSARLGMGSR